MTSQYGYFEYFDYDSFRLRKVETCPPEFEYPKDSLMGLITEKFPKFAQIVIKSKYDRAFVDGRFTVFLSNYWDQFTAAQIEQLDVADAKRIVMQTTLQGRIRRMDLLTSRDSQLMTLDDGVFVHIWVDPDNILHKNNETIVGSHETSNGIIHLTVGA